MLHMNKKIEHSFEHSLNSISLRASVLARNSSNQSGLTYSPEQAQVALEGLFDSLKNVFKDNFIVSLFKPSKKNYFDKILRVATKVDFLDMADYSFQVQEGIDVKLKQWIETLDISYQDIVTVQDHLDKVIDLFEKNSRNPANLKSLSAYGFEKLDSADKNEKAFFKLFKGHHNKKPFGELVDNESELNEVRDKYESLNKTRSSIDSKAIKDKIDQIVKLSEEFIANHANEASANRRLVKDLSIHIKKIADHISLLAQLDYSYSVLEKSSEEFYDKL